LNRKKPIHDGGWLPNHYFDIDLKRFSTIENLCRRRLVQAEIQGIFGKNGNKFAKLLFLK